MILFLNNKRKTIELLKSFLSVYLNKDTLIVNDTRSVIIKEVLPNIKFVWTYDQRILPICSNTNIVLSKPVYDNIIAYFNKLWLTKNVNIILTDNIYEKTLTEIILDNNHIINKIRNMNLKNLVTFFVDDATVALSKKLNLKLHISKKTSDIVNNKLLLKQFLINQRLPTITWTITSDIEKIKYYYFKKEKYFFKTSYWVSGYGFWDNKNNWLDDILNSVSKIWNIIIEKVVNKKWSPSLQFFIDFNWNIVVFWLTDQILSNWQIYMGNLSPSQYTYSEIGQEIFRQSKIILEWIKNNNYIWFGWIDFIVSDDNKVYATEINWRFTAATYPTITSVLLTNSLETKWIYKTYENLEETFDSFLKNSIKNIQEKWNFPLCIAPLERWGRAQVLEFI